MARGKKYTQEFKDSAIQLALNSEDSVRKIAKDLEISEKRDKAVKRVAKIIRKLCYYGI